MPPQSAFVIISVPIANLYLLVIKIFAVYFSFEFFHFFFNNPVQKVF